MPSSRSLLLLACLALAWDQHHLQAGEPAKPVSRIAFGSCAQQEKRQPIWDTIVAAKPGLFLFVGDTVYGDTQDMEVLKAKYDKLAALPGYQKLLKSCPVLATWDDHDYGANDAGAEYPKKVESQQIFLDFFDVPKDSPRRKREGVYHAEIIGPPDKSVQVILLDTRYFRSPLKKRKKFVPGEGRYEPDSDPKATMLGEAQWRWLEEELKKPAKVRLLISSIQVVAQDHHWEKWHNMPLERERLFKLIRATKASGLVVLSGDRHLGELSMMDAGIGYPLYDLTSSGLNQGSPKWRAQEINRHRVATMNHGNHYGIVQIDWDQDDPLLRLQIVDEGGEVTISHKVPLSALQPGFLKEKASSLVTLADGSPLTAEAIKSHLKKEITIEMVVAGTGMSAKSGLIFLNSDAERGPDNFTIVLDKKAQADLKDGGVADPRKHFGGKTIRVTGVLSLFNNTPQIIVSARGAIQVVE